MNQQVQSQSGQAQQQHPPGQRQYKQGSNVPPPFEKFDAADSTKKKIIYNTMIEQIKQYAKANEDFFKEQQKIPQYQQDLLRYKNENEVLKGDVQNQHLREIVDLHDKIENNQRHGINNDSLAQQMMVQFQKDKDQINAHHKSDKEVSDKKLLELQKLIQQQHTTMQTMQQQLAKESSVKKLEPHQEQKQTHMESSKIDIDKIALMERQIGDHDHEIIQAKNQNLTFKNINTHLEEQIKKVTKIYNMNKLEVQIAAQKDLIAAQHEKLLAKPTADTSQIHELNTQLHHMRDSHQRLEAEYQNMKNEIHKLKIDCQQSELERVKLEKQCSTYQEHMTSNTHHIKQLEDKLLETNSRFNELMSRYKVASQQVKTFQVQIKEYQIAMEDTVAENSGLFLDAINKIN